MKNALPFILVFAATLGVNYCLLGVQPTWPDLLIGFAAYSFGFYGLTTAYNVYELAIAPHTNTPALLAFAVVVVVASLVTASVFIALHSVATALTPKNTEASTLRDEGKAHQTAIAPAGALH